MPLTKIQSLGITDGTIVNADINASAAIAGTKLTGVGKVLQVITATDSTGRTTTSTSFVTGSNTLSVTITPSSASNKIYVLVSGTMQSSGGDTYYTIFRGATNLGNVSNGFVYLANNVYTGQCMSVLDSPSSTSALTYQVYMKADAAATARIPTGTSTATITCFEIAG
jgi:hypothetical protein